MSGRKFAPGPWGLAATNNLTIRVFEVADNSIIGTVSGQDAEAEANARLISAAPDLVEALADLLVYHDVPPDAQDPVVRPLLRAGFAAIAKARGQ